MAHFGNQDCLIKKIAQGNLFAEDCKAKALSYVMEINANCLAYSAAIMGKASTGKGQTMPGDYGTQSI